MKIVQLVFRATGENATTPAEPFAPLAGFEGDLEEEGTFCMSFDNDMLVKNKIYSVVEVCLPDWMAPEEFIRDCTKWGFAWNRGLDHELPEAWQRKLLQLDPALQVACSKLLKTKSFRSAFRQSLRNQLEYWLNGQSKYERPLSRAQAQNLVKSYDVLDAKWADDRAYWTKSHYRGIQIERPAKREEPA